MEWPEIQYASWRETCQTLHRYTQVVGKTRMRLAPPINHWWHVALYVTPRGLSTSSIPYGGDAFEVLFDFIDHELRILHSDGSSHSFALRSEPVADFYAHYMDALHSLGIDLRLWTTPVEVEERTPFEFDTAHRQYDPEFARRFWLASLRASEIFLEFRSRFLGKASPVHFFWGAFDLAVTRFSGRRAPEHPGAPNVGRHVVREAYSHEVSSAGFWPGGGGYEAPAFYAYAYPEPDRFRDYPVEPEGAFYHEGLREFLLPYDALRASRNPKANLLAFLQTTYEAAANLGGWDRAQLERAEPGALTEAASHPRAGQEA